MSDNTSIFASVLVVAFAVAAVLIIGMVMLNKAGERGSFEDMKMLESGLQQCQDIGGNGYVRGNYHWAIECELVP